MAVQWVPAAERASAISFTYANFNLGGVIGLTMVPLLADAFGGGGAFVISGAVGVGWAVAGAVIMHKVASQQAAAGAVIMHKVASQQAAAAAAAAAAAGIDGTVTGTAAAADAEQANGAASSIQETQHKQHQQQQQELQQVLPQDKQQQQQQQQPSKVQQQFSWQLDAASMRQVALLCFAHAVIGFGFFLMQVRPVTIDTGYNGYMEKHTSSSMHMGCMFKFAHVR
jgi:hypothetical protein